MLGFAPHPNQALAKKGARLGFYRMNLAEIATMLWLWTSGATRYMRVTADSDRRSLGVFIADACVKIITLKF
jgi:hypothetical protein